MHMMLGLDFEGKSDISGRCKSCTVTIRDRSKWFYVLNLHSAFDDMSLICNNADMFITVEKRVTAAGRFTRGSSAFKKWWMSWQNTWR